MKLVHATEAFLDRWPAKSRCRKCPMCQRKAQPGQWVFHHRLAAAGYQDADMLIHRTCITAAADQCPPDDIIPTDPKAQIAEIRREAIREATEREAATAA